jgi:hypothetical protein
LGPLPATFSSTAETRFWRRVGTLLSFGQLPLDCCKPVQFLGF